MNSHSFILPALALGTGALLLLPAQESVAFSTIGGDLSLNQRDFRVFNNFSGLNANDHQTPDPAFPGAGGAVLAIWKASVEWGSLAHGDGSGDPTQTSLGGSGASFDASYQGQAADVGGINDNVHSQITGASPGVLAFTEVPITDGWRIRYYENWNWADGPDTISVQERDLQGIACHEYGHALGLGHSTSSLATMTPASLPGVVTGRSISSDDRNGIRSVYGVADQGKPVISGVQVQGSTITITGSNFDPVGNNVWFTHGGATTNGVPVKVTNLVSNGTEMTLTIPSLAGPGDVLVQRVGTAHGSLSNAWPTDLLPSAPSCPGPVSFCSTSPNSVGNGALIGSSGSTSLSSNDLTLTVQGCPANKPGLFYYGPNQASAPLGNGLRCVGGNLVRLPAVFTGPNGAAAVPLDFGSSPFLSGSGAAIPGGIAYFQFWYRDPADSGAKFNLSDGLSVQYCP